ncbi:ferritin-like domain-containing protein [Hymenobacter sp. HMF4947]|uniref:Ferritin-like domain-containing protein n=1 Tax=Hymenobacter ginkgonis TaxID=2682976 RepID=A0A7K1TEF7_9BACT|nr:ferritin-like domain-containing protein [Hymenobacter ginkgonis]MVN76787.1 ferritin-like domain-containing protein [Hymenobacter ginkgonis]
MHLSSWASRTLRRRTFLRVAGSATATAGLALAGCSANDPEPTTTTPTYALTNDDTGQLNYFYLLKQLQVAFYQKVTATVPADLTGADLLTVTDLRDHEIVQQLSLGYALGATAALPQLIFDFSTLPLTTRAGVLAAAQTFEDLCSAALTFSVPFLTTADTLRFMLKIASVEARHAATVRDLLAPTTLAAPDAVLTSGGPLANIATPADVLKAITPYITLAVIDVSLLPIA